MVSLNIRPKDELGRIDYDLMAEKYQMFKYYPKYFHNEIETPNIKEKLRDKLIYSKANEHIEGYVNPGVMKIYETELNLQSGQLRITKEIDDKETQMKSKLTPKEKLEKRREKYLKYKKLADRKALIESKSRIKPNSNHTMEFNNPFQTDEKVYGLTYSLGHKKSTDTLNDNMENISLNSDPRRHSMASRLISFILNSSDEYKLERTSTFDQTKSSLTSGRKKLFRAKRHSDQISMYYFWTDLLKPTFLVPVD